VSIYEISGPSPLNNKKPRKTRLFVWPVAAMHGNPVDRLDQINQ
jgi:hypothetical protein